MKNNEPLAYYLRPTTLDEVVWQQQTKLSIQKFLENWQVPSMIFWWSPGCWKTTIANVLSHQLQADFFELSWVKSKKEDLNTILEHAEKNKAYWKKTLLFLDEIHRRNKAQQDSLLPFVESGLITLIGATTENPSFDFAFQNLKGEPSVNNVVDVKVNNQTVVDANKVANITMPTKVSDLQNDSNFITNTVNNLTNPCRSY